MRELVYNSEEEFLSGLREIVKQVDPKKIKVVMPYHIEEVEEILRLKDSKVKFFTLVGCVVGCIIGFALTVWTSLSWPMIVGGKPPVTLVPYVIIAFELTALLGGILTTLGFFILSREKGNVEIGSDRFIIYVEEN